MRVLTWETETLVPLRGLCPFFGLVIYPNGLEIMTNHNNNSQLNKNKYKQKQQLRLGKEMAFGDIILKRLETLISQAEETANQPT